MLNKQRVLGKYGMMPVQVKASFWFFVCTVLQRSISIVTTPIYTRMLNTYEYGQYGIFTSWKGLLSCFITLQIFSSVYMQAIIKHENERDKYTSAMEGLTLVMVVTWLGFYLITRVVWNEKIGLNTPQIIAMFIVIWGNAVFEFWSTAQRVDYKYRGLLIVTLAMALVQPVLCIFFIKFFTNKVTGLVWGIAASTLAIYFLLFIKHIYKGKLFFSRRIWKYALGFAIPLIPHYISSIILNSSDRIMIQQLIGESEAGIYSLAYTISICGTMINQAVLQTFSPWLFQKIKENKFQEIPKVAYLLLIAIGLIDLVIVLLTPEIVKIFAPSEYYDAIWVMPPIALSVLFMFMYNLFACFEIYYEKKSYVSTATMVGAGLNVVLNYVFIPVFGYIAAGYTTLICYIMFAFSHFFFMRKICKEKNDKTTIYKPQILLGISLIYLILGGLIVLTYRNIYLRYSIVAISFIAVFTFRKKILAYLSMVLIAKKNNVSK